ncbi:hypothetical protein C4566_01515 [Candidatus Parcubacteria bacterium]|nr:MAG: hypothetical protein C4566_01515 [Candidatus Parcubacteria bacterium]
MILILYLKDRDRAAWLAVLNDSIKLSHDFLLISSQDSLLLNLDIFLKKNKLKLTSFSALILAIHQASLTQVKIATATANVLAWRFNWPLVGSFYFKEDFLLLLPKLLKNIKAKSKFSLLKVKYERQPDITISKKKPKFKIKK